MSKPNAYTGPDLLNNRPVETALILCLSDARIFSGIENFSIILNGTFPLACILRLLNA